MGVTSGFEVSRVQGFKGSRVQGFKGSRVQGKNYTVILILICNTIIQSSFYFKIVNPQSLV
ncbi:MAG: hypothetical protein WBD61_09235, partial [Desulfobulbales bacterium]